MNEKHYLTLKEAQNIAKLSNSTLRRLVKTGKLKSSRPTRKIVIERGDLDAFMRGELVG